MALSLKRNATQMDSFITTLNINTPGHQLQLEDSTTTTSPILNLTPGSC